MITMRTTSPSYSRARSPAHSNTATAATAIISVRMRNRGSCIEVELTAPSWPPAEQERPGDAVQLLMPVLGQADREASRFGRGGRFIPRAEFAVLRGHGMVGFDE